jgi:hypothetical protein
MMGSVLALAPISDLLRLPLLTTTMALGQGSVLETMGLEALPMLLEMMDFLLLGRMGLVPQQLQLPTMTGLGFKEHILEC